MAVAGSGAVMVSLLINTKLSAAIELPAVRFTKGTFEKADPQTLAAV